MEAMEAMGGVDVDRFELGSWLSRWFRDVGDGDGERHRAVPAMSRGDGGDGTVWGTNGASARVSRLVIVNVGGGDLLPSLLGRDLGSGVKKIQLRTERVPVKNSTRYERGSTLAFTTTAGCKEP
jgi:hypothetical protein